ncbi:MAG: 3-hydroxyacyl-ACP dehydratase FabZ [Myxococcota bacterium]
MDIDVIRRVLPHRYPFLLIDRVVEVGGGRIKAFKNVTANEEYFQGHFPDHPVVPGVILVEAMAQAGALLAHVMEGSVEGKLIYLMGLDKVRFRRPVVPGDRPDIPVEMLRHRGRVWKQQAVASVGECRAAECIVLATTIDREKACP